MNDTRIAQELLAVARLLSPARTAVNADVDAAAELIESSGPIVDRLVDMVDDLRKGFDRARDQMVRAQKAGIGVTESDTFLSPRLSELEKIRKYSDQMIRVVGRALR